jgi:hypothetical protein
MLHEQGKTIEAKNVGREYDMKNYYYERPVMSNMRSNRYRIDLANKGGKDSPLMQYHKMNQNMTKPNEVSPNEISKYNN